MTAEPYLQPQGISRSGVAFVVALHGVAFWLLLQLNVVSLPAPLAVLSVSLIPSLPAMPPPAEITPPPKPIARRPLPAPQAVAQSAPLAVAASAAVPAAVMPVATPLAPPSPPAAPAAAATPAPSAPRFDADYLDNPRPAYPSLSRRLGEEGKVVLRVQVLADGRADDIQLHASSGSPRLDQAARDAVRRWRFVPARQGETAVAAWVLVPIAFTLKE